MKMGVSRCCSVLLDVLGDARRAPSSLISDWSILPRCGTSNGSSVLARYVEAAVGRHISRRWALNSRFYRAMKMSRLINTSGSRSHSRTSLLPLPAPRLTFLSLSFPSPSRGRNERGAFVCRLYGFRVFLLSFLSVRE